MTIEAYQVGVNLFANAERITGPIGEMISALERLLQAQKSAQSGFNDMTSALGGARRLARGMADDMERAARAAQNVASASSRFRPGGSSGAGHLLEAVRPRLRLCRQFRQRSRGVGRMSRPILLPRRKFPALRSLCCPRQRRRRPRYCWVTTRAEKRRLCAAVRSQCMVRADPG